MYTESYEKILHRILTDKQSNEEVDLDLCSQHLVSLTKHDTLKDFIACVINDWCGSGTEDLNRAARRYLNTRIGSIKVLREEGNLCLKINLRL